MAHAPPPVPDDPHEPAPEYDAWAAAHIKELDEFLGRLRAAAGRLASLSPGDVADAAAGRKPEPVGPDVIRQLAALPEFRLHGPNRQSLAGVPADIIRSIAENLGIAARPPETHGVSPPEPREPPKPPGDGGVYGFADEGVYGFADETGKKPPVDIIYQSGKDRDAGRRGPVFKTDTDRILNDIRGYVARLVDQGKGRAKQTDEKGHGSTPGGGDGPGLMDRMLEFVGRRGGRVGRIINGAVGHHREINRLLGRSGAGAVAVAGAGGEAAAGADAGAAAGAGSVVPVIGVVIAATAAMVELAKAAKDAAYSQEQHNRQLAEYSPSQAAVAGRMDANRAVRKMELGESTASSSQSLTAALDRFEKATLPMEKLTNNLSNAFLSGVMNALASIAETLGPILDVLNEMFGEKVTVRTEGDVLEEIARLEDRKAAARRQNINASRRAGDF